MLSSEVREKYLKFFEKRGHKIIPPAPLVLENDPTTLFTSSGMQPLVPYLMGKEYPGGIKRLVDSQPSFRAQDIEEVGDNRHTTFFEMLGNWSLGDYFKEDQLNWFFSFLVDSDEKGGLGLDPKRLYVSVFEGNEYIPKDDESIMIWQKLFLSCGVDAEVGERIFKYGVKKNWWSRSGTPDQMPVGEIGGPDSEVFYDFGKNLGLHEKSQWKDEVCHPNCDCGRFLEIGNSVFIQYIKNEDGFFKELPQRNVDFGGGLERLTAATNDDPDVFKTDLFWPVIKKIEELSGKKYEDEQSSMRVITDHLKAAVFLANDGVVSGNKLQGYVLRRLIRRSATKAFNINRDFGSSDDFHKLADEVIEVYRDSYFSKINRDKVQETIVGEILKFRKNLESGLKKIDQVFQNRNDINGEQAFELNTTYGFPIELLVEEAKARAKTVDLQGFQEEMKKHQELSRKSSENKFKIK